MIKTKKEKLTPLFVRDQLIQCFIKTNKKFLKEQAKKSGKNLSPQEIEKRLKADVKKAFELVNEDFSNPKKESFPKVISLLRQKSKLAKKTEKEIMQHIHQIMALVKKL